MASSDSASLIATFSSCYFVICLLKVSETMSGVNLVVTFCAEIPVSIMRLWQAYFTDVRSAALLFCCRLSFSETVVIKNYTVSDVRNVTQLNYPTS